MAIKSLFVSSLVFHRPSLKRRTHLLRCTPQSRSNERQRERRRFSLFPPWLVGVYQQVHNHNRWLEKRPVFVSVFVGQWFSVRRDDHSFAKRRTSTVCLLLLRLGSKLGRSRLLLWSPFFLLGKIRRRRRPWWHNRWLGSLLDDGGGGGGRLWITLDVLKVFLYSFCSSSSSSSHQNHRTAIPTVKLRRRRRRRRRRRIEGRCQQSPQFADVLFVCVCVCVYNLPVVRSSSSTVQWQLLWRWPGRLCVGDGMDHIISSTASLQAVSLSYIRRPLIYAPRNVVVVVFFLFVCSFFLVVKYKRFDRSNDDDGRVSLRTRPPASESSQQGSFCFCCCCWCWPASFRSHWSSSSSFMHPLLVVTL